MKKIKIPMAKPSIDKFEINAINKVLKSGWYGQGIKTEKFEKLLSNYFTSPTICVNNGTSALLCSLLVHDIKPGDIIVIPSFTFIATSSAPKILGCKIIPVDVNLQTMNIDLNLLEEVFKNNDVKAVIFVDIGGLPNNIHKIKKLCKLYNVIPIEDAAEALGSEYKSKKIGSFPHTTTFSFHIAKQITTIEGGCITTKNQLVLNKLKAIRDHGRIKKGYHHEFVGSNFRTTDIQSVIGISQLKKINKLLKNRINIAKQYKSELSSLEFQEIPSFVSKHSYMLFFVKTKNLKFRNKFVNYLNSKGIDARNSWLPINLQRCNKELNSINCSNSLKLFETTFTLPIFNSMTSKEVDYIIKHCKKFIG